MSRISEKLIVGQHHFTSFEIFSSVLRGYDLDIKQIDCGPFSALMKQLQCGPITLNHFITTRRFEANGNPPPGVRTFGVPTTKCQPFVWRGKKSSGNTIQIYKPCTELALITNPHFEAIDVSINEDDFNVLNRQWGFPNLDKIIGNTEMITCDPAIMQRLRNTLQFICDSLDSNSTHPEPHIDLHNLIKREVPYLLALALMSSVAHTVKATADKRSHALKTAIDYIQSNSNELVSINKLCHETGINERTLQRVFFDQYGVTPKSYVNTQQLNNTYKTLLYSAPLTTKVTDIAISHGFCHMSQFAADYQRQFGELPSETLKKNC